MLFWDLLWPRGWVIDALGECLWWATFPSLFLYLCIMALTVIHRSPKALEMTLSPFPDDRGHWLCFLSCFFRLWDDAFEDLLTCFAFVRQVLLALDLRFPWFITVNHCIWQLHPFYPETNSRLTPNYCGHNASYPPQCSCRLISWSHCCMDVEPLGVRWACLAHTVDQTCIWWFFVFPDLLLRL